MLPLVVDIRGGPGTGKTWTLITVAARFVVATRPSLFAKTSSTTAAMESGSVDTNNNNADDEEEENGNNGGNNLKQNNGIDEDDDISNNSAPAAAATAPLPQVIFLDTTMNVTPDKLYYAVRSTLLLAQQQQQQQQQEQKPQGDDKEESPNPTDWDEDVFQDDLECCMSRIHLATADADTMGYVALLEMIRTTTTTTTTAPPILLLWDGFLQHNTFAVDEESSRMEIIRQLHRIIEQNNHNIHDDSNEQDTQESTPVPAVVMTASATRSNNYSNYNRRTTSNNNSSQSLWDSHVTHGIRLERNHQQQQQQHPDNDEQQGPVMGSARGEHDCIATLDGGVVQIPFSLSLKGILS
jgi:hypothetical protein